MAALGRYLRGLVECRMARRIPSCAAAMRMAFVVSAPRSGSTWLKTALNVHPQVYCTENRLLGSFFDVWPEENGARSPRITMDAYVESLCRHINVSDLGLTRRHCLEMLLHGFIDTLRSFCAHHSGKEIMVDKITPYVDTADKVVASLTHYFPGAPIVHLVRDGRDVLTSGVFHWMTRLDKGTARYERYIDGRRDIRIPRFFKDEEIEIWTKRWMQPSDALRKRVEPCLTVRYEEMIVNQRAILAEVFRSLGVEAQDAVLDSCVEQSSFRVMSGGRSRGEEQASAMVRKGTPGDWQNYFTRRDGEIFERNAGRLLKSLGYESDDAWVERLPEKLELPS